MQLDFAMIEVKGEESASFAENIDLVNQHSLEMMIILQLSNTRVVKNYHYPFPLVSCMVSRYGHVVMFILRHMTVYMCCAAQETGIPHPLPINKYTRGGSRGASEISRNQSR